MFLCLLISGSLMLFTYIDIKPSLSLTNMMTRMELKIRLTIFEVSMNTVRKKSY